MRSDVKWCGGCRDYGEVSAEKYLGPNSEYAGSVSCPDCPTCPCGMRFSDHKDESTQEFLEPTEIVRGLGEFWAPACLNEYLREAKSHGTV